MPKYGGKFGKGYYVVWGHRGYIPDGHMWQPNKKDAIAAAIDEIEFFADSAWQIVDEPDVEFTAKDIEEAIADAKRNIRKDLYADLNREIFGVEYMEIADAEIYDPEYED